MSSRETIARLDGIRSMLERVKGPTASVRIYEHEAKAILAALSEGKSATEGEVVKVVDEMVGMLAPDQGEMLTIEGRRLLGLASRAQTLLRAASPTGEDR